MLAAKKEGILLRPTQLKFENYGVCNPGCIIANGDVHMFYRATTKENYSTIGYCRLNSPLTIVERYDKPILIPQHKYESVGMEDPRIVKIEDTYFMTYTAYDGKNALGALAISKDLKEFTKKGIITPQLTYKDFQLCIGSCEDVNEKYLRFVRLLYERVGAEAVSKLLVWDKDVMFFPEKINGKFAFLHRIYPDIQIVYFNDLKDLTEEFWRDYLFNLKNYTLLEGIIPFEASYIGGGCPPIKTDAGWLLIYHGVQDTHEGYIYHAAAALLDSNDPTKQIGHLKYPLFSPELEWEKEGVVNNVVFPTGAVVQDDLLYIYYGAADKYTAVATVKLKELINELKKELV